MRILEVYIEHAALDLDRPFSYAYLGDKKVEKGYRVSVPFRNQILIGFVSSVIETPLTKEEYEEKTAYILKEVIDVIDEECLLNDMQWKLATFLSNYYFTPLIRVLQTMLPPSLKPKSSSLKAPKIAYETYVEIVSSNEEGLTDQQIEWLRRVAKEERILKKDFRSKPILEKLIALERVKLVKEEKRRLTIKTSPMETPKALTEDQQKAIQSFLTSSKETTLLEGVTGSGKTEVYLRLAEHYIQNGKSVLFLVPEISLTPMMIEYFSRRFIEKIAILHSELTPGQKYDEYRRIASGQAKIVIGARSAIFAPLKNLGLIILDEEHVETYKQENAPCYHALEVAKWRAKEEGARILLGSATPSLESRARALKGVYGYIQLTNRIHQGALPETEIIDLLNPNSVDKDSVLFSLSLRKAMKEALDKKEQIVLLLNRRGYAPYVSCRKCGYVFKCPTCDIALSYHKEDQMLKCHHCDFVMQAPKVCPECGSTYLSKQGFGTERIEEEVTRLFPHAKTLRLDSDVSKVRQNVEKVLKKFQNQEADILIGTQMIAKGHDFQNVTLVGVVLADMGLTMPSFRSSERTFQLITQAVGRAGRGTKKGKAFIQTYMPTHYAVRLGAKQDYTHFFQIEMNSRRMQQYPPYTYLISLTLTCISEDKVHDIALEIKEMLEEENIEDLTILGPTVPYIKKQGNMFVEQLLLKYKKAEKIEIVLDKIRRKLALKSGYRLKIDRDPYDF